MNKQVAADAKVKQEKKAAAPAAPKISEVKTDPKVFKKV